ncbi:peptidoglycan D,D-transpeptidase FtsI family protein [Bacillus alkalicellulosilyticus]|uniref:peptidoglycan D,D-transpeptidase FtsI family protein n=1 Tax=Alkalihalobacterium alkalicellulosilyticum TaxID=1912214 RepID=UPI000996C9C6|nr:penicillin-binding protein 2 [Bacillus alkalicellulosilyticus]
MAKPQIRKNKNHIPYRLNLLFLVVFVLFSALVLRLGIVQIVQGEEFVRQLENTNNTTARIDAPRGLIYDRYGNLVVDNQLQLSIIYTPGKSTSHAEKLEVAKKLEQLIEVEEEAINRINERDRKDYWILTRPEDAKAKLSPEEQKELNNDPKDVYELTLERITEEDFEEITAKETRVLAIKREMDLGYALSPQRIKQAVSDEEAHIVGEHLSELPGVDILRDSTRVYRFGDTFRSYLGNTNHIPKEKIDYFLSRGYERSDLVGISYLEQQYEEVLRGQKAVIESVTNRGDVIGEKEKLGLRGNDLVLTIDMELQQKIDQIVEKRVNQYSGSYIRDRSAYVAIMCPKTGEILALSGYPDSTGVIFNSFAMGSAVKGATVLMGYDSGVINRGDSLHDTPITLPGLAPKDSAGRRLGWINDVSALQQSSNVYMFYIAMRMAGYNYGTNCCWRDIPGTFEQMRSYYSQFGLGAETGIDLPNVSNGMSGGIGQGGNLLDFSIGQFDTYTTLQLVQYTATIANDGYRMQPRLVKEILEPGLQKDEMGPVVHQMSPTVLNRVTMSDADLQRVQQGFQAVLRSPGTWGNASFKYATKVAAKTGTAQVRVPIEGGYPVDGNNQTLIAYAPYDDPEIAVAVVVPHVRIKADAVSREIMTDVLDSYFELKGKRKGTLIQDNVVEELDSAQD